MSRAAETRSAAPVFTASKLRKIMDGGVLKRGVKPSTAHLEWLAVQLNFICRQRKLTLESPAKQARYAAFGGGLGTLMAFFQERKGMCRAKNGKRPSARVIEAEQRWRNGFAKFLRATKAHNKFILTVPQQELLETDFDDVLVVPCDSWRAVAGEVALFFRVTVRRNNPGMQLGFSNDGPVPRFVADVVPLITDERPAVANVAKHLKDEARKDRLRQKPGTTSKSVVPGTKL